jgi:hypothetical protein
MRGSGGREEGGGKGRREGRKKEKREGRGRREGRKERRKECIPTLMSMKSMW